MRVGPAQRDVSLLGPVRGRDNPSFARLNVAVGSLGSFIDEALVVLVKNNKANDRVLEPVQD
jgi:hypothetical protein